MTGGSCTDEVRVKVPSFQNFHFLVWFKIFLRYDIHLYFNSLEVVNNKTFDSFSSCITQDEKESKVL